jgi:hypothetical protein
MKKVLLFVVIAPLAAFAVTLAALRFREFDISNYEMWE